jgi:lycopene cyclase domain-containing protein
VLNYLLTILAVLALPAVLVARAVRPHVRWAPFLASIASITALGSLWSATLSAQGWWSFSATYRTGITLGPHLLLEEFLFYPCGGALSVLLYVLGERAGHTQFARGYWATVLGGTAAFLALVAAAPGRPPHYLTSMIVLYNLVVTLPLAPWVAPRVGLAGFVTSVLGMTTIGFLWDALAFRYHWWTYHAASGWTVWQIPVDDFDFFLFAPAAAVSIYVTLCLVESSWRSAGVESVERAV